ncbi:amidohydrolase family protein [Rhodococcus sp. IEGM 1307]|uniref:N-acyl-D-amino-acid deacylase family protein n=1 Tax=Rhodococcus sp. IEGM 1307 TaxID=3047091 RepID=UPI0024B82B9E|nr:amidohydrolase family protein [Rhodococcus sp. IEGM 1307]MDI9979611.1 amidohydrolase family protein [Rhodococcus sp. IEGM 1307]
MQAHKPDTSGDLLVRGGTLIDGTGGPQRRADVRVRDGIVAEIGPDLARDGEQEVDASGAIVTPGFIDGHTHYDPSLFWDPSCDPMPQHGVTTVLFGNCSLSLAPVRQSDRASLSETFAVIEEIPELGFSDHIPWDWESYPEYIASMGSRGFGVNVAGLVGLSALRLFVIGKEAWERPSTPEERQQMAALLDDALRAGASGFSTSYFDRGADGRLVPSAMADDTELEALLAVTGAHRGHFEVLSQMMDHPVSMDQLERCARLCGAADVAMTWNGFIDWDKDPSIIDGYLGLARRLQAEGLRAYPTISPHPQEFMANWQGGMGFISVPAWNELLQAADEATQGRMLADPAWRERAAADWDRIPKTTFPHHDLDRVRIETVERPDLEQFVGESFGSWAKNHGGHPSDALADWLQLNDLHPGLAYTTGNANHERIGAFLNDPATVVSASDAGAHIISHCNTGDTTLLLTRYVRDRGDLPLEKAIAEMTSRPADLYGFADIGRLEVGKRGDLTVFELDALTFGRPEAVFDFPGDAKRYRRPAGGYRVTAVNGVPTQIDGKATDNLPGEWLPGKKPCRI